MSSVSGHVYLAKRKRGNVWYMRYRVGTDEIRKKIGPAHTGKGRPVEGTFTEKAARAVLDATLTDARRGHSGKPTGVLFAEAAAEYLRYVAEEKQIDAKTARDYAGVVNKRLIPEFGDRKIAAITPDMIDAWKVRLMREGTSNRVVIRYLTVLHGVFKRAKRKYGLSDNPASADMVQRPSLVYTGEFVTYTREELDLLVAHADRQDGVLILVAAMTGLRQGELLALRWADVDFVAGLVHVRRNFTDGRTKIPKGKTVRSVVMIPDVVDALAHHKNRGGMVDDDGLVFVNTAGGHLDNHNLRRRYYRAIEKAGLRKIQFHDLRHHFGTFAIRALDGYAVQSYMGHQHYSTTQRYLHHQPRPDDAAKLAAAFDVPEYVPEATPSDPTEANSAE